MKGRARQGRWQALLMSVLAGLVLACIGTAAVVAATRTGSGVAAQLATGIDAVVPAPLFDEELRGGAEADSDRDGDDSDLGLEAMTVASEGEGEDEDEQAPPTVQVELHSNRKRFIPRLPKAGRSKIAYFKELRREKLTRRLREGGMLRRYAPDMFNSDVYGVDDNDNVKVGSRATIWDAMNGPFAPMKPQRPPVDEGMVSRLLNADEKAHALADKREKIRHLEDASALAGRDPYAAAFTYLPANHRTKPFGFGRLIARARHWQALDVGPFERSARTWNHAAQNPLSTFKGYDHAPLPYTPHMPFAEADAAFMGMRPNKLQQFKEFVPPPAMPKFAAAPADKGGAAGGDAAAGGGGDAAGGGGD